MKARFMHIADVHLGYAQYGSSERYNDFYRSFSAAISDALHEQVDLVIIAGDLFHQRTLSPQTLLQGAHELERLRDASIPVIGVIGNHEQPHYRDKFSWLDYLAGRRLLTLLNPRYVDDELALTPHDGQSGSYVDVAGMRVYGMRYAGAVTPRLVADAAVVLSQQPASEKPAFTMLVAHAGLDGIVPNFGANITREQLAVLHPHVDYLALGHIHKPYQEDGWIFNPGSLEPNSFPEVEYRGGAFLVDVDTEREPRIDITARRYATRPFVRLTLDVGEFESPDALYAGVEVHLAAQRDAYEKRPVVELSLEGILHVDRKSLSMDRIEATLQETLNPIAGRVRNRATPAEYEMSAGAGQLSRSELEAQVLADLLARDARYRKHAARWATLVREMKQMALERNSPETIATHLRAGIDEIAQLEDAHADHTH